MFPCDCFHQHRGAGEVCVESVGNVREEDSVSSGSMRVATAC